MKAIESNKLLQFFAKTVFLTVLLMCSNKILGIGKPLIFPTPKQLELTSESFILDETVVVVIPENPKPNDLLLAHLLIKELSDKYGLPLTLQSFKSVPKYRKVIVMGTLDNSFVKSICAQNQLILTKKAPGPEGYLMYVTNKMILIGGSDDAGAFYGLQSLRQLVLAGNGQSIQGVKIRDWPSLKFRAIRVYVPGPENIVFFKRFMSDFMALYKYNKIIMEFNCMRLDKHPEVNTGWLEFVKYMQYSRVKSPIGLHGEWKNSSHYDAGDGYIIEKPSVRDLVKFADDNFLEVIPEIPSLSHSYYLLAKHPELAEYPGDPWPDTYCPSNSKSYDLLFDVFDEYIEIIKPKMVHIGHDEWYGAVIGICPRCKGKDYSKLFAQDVNKIHDYFEKKKIKIAMWGDYLLESVRGKETQKLTSATGIEYKTPGALPSFIVKEMIPKDILIFNWFWDDAKREKELDDLGFKQVYGNFKSNIKNWDQRIRFGIVGGAPSSWASTNEFNFGKDLLLDFLGCANLMWSGHSISQIDMSAILWELMPSIRANLKAKRMPSKDENPIESINISSYFNLSKDAKTFNIDLSNMRSGEVQKGNVLFNLPDSTGQCVIAVGSEGTEKNTFPNKVMHISINEDVSSLIFLHASAYPGNNQKAFFNIFNNFDSPDLLGWYEIIYEDGFKEIIPIQYGVNILEWNPGGEQSVDTLEGEQGVGVPQKMYCYEADPINCSVNMKHDSPIFFAFEWINQRFGKQIKEVNLFGSNNYQTLMQDYGTIATMPMKNNAVLLAGISKVKKRIILSPQK